MGITDRLVELYEAELKKRAEENQRLQLKVTELEEEIGEMHEAQDVYYHSGDDK